MEHTLRRPSEFLGLRDAVRMPSESIGRAHSFRLRTDLSGPQQDFTRAISEVFKYSPQDDDSFFQAIVSSAHCCHTFATLAKNIMEHVFPLNDDLGRRAFWLLSMRAVISVKIGFVSDHRLGYESKYHRPENTSGSSRPGLSTVEDVYHVLRTVNDRFVEATGGLGLEDPVVFEAWSRLNGSARCDPLFNLHLKLEEQKADSASRLSFDEASKLADVSADLDRLFEKMELAVKGKTSDIPAPSNEATSMGLSSSTHPQSSEKKRRRATLATTPNPLRPVSTSSPPTESRRTASEPVVPSSRPRRTRAASMSQTPRVSFVLPLPRLSTEIDYGAHPVQKSRMSYDIDPNPPSYPKQRNPSSSFSPQSNAQQGYGTPRSHIASAPDNTLGPDGVSQLDKAPPTSGVGHRTLRRREKGSISIVDGKIRYPNSNDMIPVGPGSQVSQATTRHLSGSNDSRDEEIARPGLTSDGHEIRYYDSCMVVGPDSVVVPYLPDDSCDVPGMLMQHRPYTGRH